MDYFSLFASKRPLVKDGLLEIYVYEDDVCLPYIPNPSKIVIVESIAEDANTQQTVEGIPIFDAFTGQWVPFMDNPEVVAPTTTLEQNVIYDPYLKMLFKRPDVSPCVPKLTISKRTLLFHIKQKNIEFQQVWDMSSAKYRTPSGKTFESSDTTPVIYFKDIVQGEKKVEGPIFSTYQDGDWVKLSPL